MLWTYFGAGTLPEICRDLPMHLPFRIMGFAVVFLAMAASTAAQTTALSDSLMREYERMWKSSDSLRIQAMLARMEASRVQKAAKANDEAIMADVQARAMVERARIKQQTAKAGISVADSVTLIGLGFQADTGVASFYANEFHGRPTSSGERYNMNDATCAHRWLPFGTRLHITNMLNGRSAVVRVNDRGPWKHGRIVDVSKVVAQRLDFVRAGTATVVIRLAQEEESPSNFSPSTTETEP